MSANLNFALGAIDSLRERAHGSPTIKTAAIGACPLGDGRAATSAPVCPDYSLDYLCANYNQVVVVVRSLAGGATTTATFNPLDTVFCPVAVSATFWDSADPTLKRTAWVFNVNVRGCLQFDFSNQAGDTVAAATGFVDVQSEWDPTFKSDCKACPVDWSCFTNPGLNSATLNMIIGNPQAGAITGKVSLWGIPYSCCPSFIPADDYNQGRRRRGVPVGAPAPLGTARRGEVFARQA